MAGKGRNKDSKGGVIVKKYEIVEGGHHGGAWKVAYADFVTAMMAFFLLMWLLNATTEDQRKGLADYFSPNNLMSHASSGTGQPFGGHTAFDQGAMVSDRGSVQITVGKRPVIERTEDGDDPIYSDYHRAKVGDGLGAGPMKDDQDADDPTSDAPLGQKGTQPAPGPGGASVVQREGQPAGPAGTSPGGTSPGGTSSAGTSSGNTSSGNTSSGVTAAELAAEKAHEEKTAFERAADQIKAAVRSDPALAELAKQLTIDMTPQGLRIQLLDEVKLPMFPTGSSTPNERVRLLLQKVVPVLMKLKEPISIAGHTDAAPFPGPDRTNWELSAERANATRRLLAEDGLPDRRIKSVIGDADRDPLLPADPLAAANRRIAILVQREAAPVPPGVAAAAVP
jgi:chemotaxis protein MotB